MFSSYGHKEAYELEIDPTRIITGDLHINCLIKMVGNNYLINISEDTIAENTNSRIRQQKTRFFGQWLASALKAWKTRCIADLAQLLSKEFNLKFNAKSLCNAYFAAAVHPIAFAQPVVQHRATLGSTGHSARTETHALTRLTRLAGLRRRPVPPLVDPHL